MTYGDYIIYVDESGDHGLGQNIDTQYPVFVLACCIFRKDQYAERSVPALQRFKFQWWGHDLVTLHESEIRKSKPPFRFLLNEARRAAFMDGLNGVIEQSPFTLVASVIDKQRLQERYVSPVDPYTVAMEFCIERICRFLGDKDQAGRLTHMVFEGRWKEADDALELAFRRALDGRTHAGKVDWLEIKFATKRHNSTGLQIADLIARPIGRHHLNPDQPNRAYELIRPKFRKSPTGRIEGYGCKVFPQ